MVDTGCTLILQIPKWWSKFDYPHHRYLLCDILQHKECPHLWTIENAAKASRQEDTKLSVYGYVRVSADKASEQYTIVYREPTVHKPPTH
jgi:hypothetical protein